MTPPKGELPTMNKPSSLAVRLSARHLPTYVPLSFETTKHLVTSLKNVPLTKEVVGHDN
ncbi:hypothetical protein JCM31185_14620 [Furfurilactobacillus curtus]|uniref:Uncharacterized protein n=1 Tax=Furfurilactobacillus curtus TaxID=1746200 RepID=A0ABQ5JPJ7_9LACO